MWYQYNVFCLVDQSFIYIISLRYLQVSSQRKYFQGGSSIKAVTGNAAKFCGFDCIDLLNDTETDHS